MTLERHSIPEVLESPLAPPEDDALRVAPE
jgi:hypothetical protein